MHLAGILQRSIELHGRFQKSVEGVGHLGYFGDTSKITLTLTSEMRRRLGAERKRRALAAIPGVIRMILSEYVSTHPIEER